VLITGGSSGIGKSICELLNSQGFEVYGTSRNPANHASSNIPLLKLDVTSEESMEALQREITEKIGGLDILINNAGIGFMGPLEHAKVEHIKTAWETNVLGVMRITQHLLPLLRKSDSARIVNIGSIGGKMGLPYRGWYSAAKGSLEILGESLSMELKPFGIQVCTVMPGDVNTPIVHSRVEPQESELVDYKNSYSRMKEILSQEMKSSISPDEVAKVILKVLEKRNMPLKKVAGSFTHKISPILKNILPQKWFQYLILRHYS